MKKLLLILSMVLFATIGCTNKEDKLCNGGEWILNYTCIDTITYYSIEEDEKLVLNFNDYGVVDIIHNINKDTIFNYKLDKQGEVLYLEENDYMPVEIGIKIIDTLRINTKHLTWYWGLDKDEIIINGIEYYYTISKDHLMLCPRITEFTQSNAIIYIMYFTHFNHGNVCWSKGDEKGIKHTF